MNMFLVYAGGGALLFLVLLAWAAYLDQVHFSDGLPGIRPLAKWYTNGDGIYLPGPPPSGLVDHKEITD